MRFLIAFFAFFLSVALHGQNEYSMSFDGVDDYVSVYGMGGTYSTFSFVTKARLVADNFNQSLFYFGQESTSNNSTGSIDLTIDDINYDPAALRINLNFDNGSVEYQPLTLNSWVDVAGVFDGVNQMLYMYIDGQLVSSTSTTVSDIVLTNNDPHKIGAGFSSATQSITNFFNGDIFNLAFFDKTLSQQEIQNYMSCPPSGNEEGLLGYWNFEEGSGTTAFDQTANGNDGTINGAIYSLDVPTPNTSYTDITACDSVVWNGTTYTESGTYYYSDEGSDNYSMSFDGVDDWVALPASAVNNLNYGTYMTWVKLVDNTNETLLVKHSDAENTYSSFSIGSAVLSNGHGALADPGRVYFHSRNQIPNASSLGIVNTGVYTHIAISFNQTSVSFYINGQYSGTTNGDYSITNDLSVTSVWLGRFVYSGCMDGVMDDFSIWNQNLTQQEIQNYMSCPPTGNEEGLVGYWNFEESSGSIAYDQTSNGNDGTINGPTFTTNAPAQSCQLTNTNGCDSTAVLNLTINLPETSYTDITACDSVVWNGITYSESGSYSYSGETLPIVGTAYNGGLVFYTDPITRTGLIATDNYIGSAEWGCYGTAVDGADGQNIGSGQQNTLDIINAGCTSNNGNPTAASIAYNYDNGYNDWYLPSLDELSLVYQNLHSGEIVNYDTGDSMNWYWSSTEGCQSDEEGAASDIVFTDGSIIYCNNKNSWPGGVIAIRSFNMPEFKTINGCDSTAVLNLTMLPCDAVSTFCGEGTVWDADAQECIVANPTDTNFDGCTDLNDLLDILSAYGDCAEVNYSLSFDGVDDYVKGSASSSLDVTNTNNITLSAWVKPNDFNGSQRIISHTSEGSDHQQYSLHVSNGQIYFISGASLFEQNGFNLSSSNLELGVWNNISMTYDGSAVRLYLDGNIVFEKLQPDYFPSDWMGYFYIGKRADGEEQFNGYIDEVSIWNSALTQQQIQTYMSTPPTGNEEGLVGYWDFNEGTGSTLTDHTSNGNDGVINGATWSTDVPTAQ